MVVCIADELLEVSCFLQILDAAQFLDFSNDLLYCMHDFVCMCDGRVGNSFVFKINYVGEVFFLGGFDVACMHAVVIW